MFQEHEKVKNIAQTIQSIVVSVAIVIGGGWTALEFYQLDRVEKAKADLQAQRNAADQKAVINISIEAENEKAADSAYIRVNVSLKNTGKKDAYMDYSTPVLSVTRVMLEKNGVIRYESQVKSQIYMPTDTLQIGHIPNAVIRGGETKDYPFIIPIKEPGIFLIRFVAKVSSQDKRPPLENQNYQGEWSHQIIHIVNKI